VRDPALYLREMAGMRDRLIHACFRVDHGLVWRTASARLPGIASQVRELLQLYGSEGIGPQELS
jgi:uncharacterized protein with HEPN domain